MHIDCVYVGIGTTYQNVYDECRISTLHNHKSVNTCFGYRRLANSLIDTGLGGRRILSVVPYVS